MSCSPFDLRDYFLNELSSPERRQVEAHASGCGACREELDRLRLTEAALLSVREEELPRRIAFVSDKVFEPSPARRAWAAFWGSTSRLGFASAAMLSIALIVFAVERPRAIQPAAVTPAAATLSADQIQQQIQTAVTQAVAASEARQEKQFAERIADIERKDLKDRQQLVAWTDSMLDYSRRHELAVVRTGYGPPHADAGGAK